MRLNKLEKQIIEEIKRIPSIESKGRAMQIGIWETKDFIELTPKISEVWMAKFRFILFYPVNGVELLKVEMYPASFYEWETVFNGIIPSVDFFRTLLTKGFSIQLTSNAQHDYENQ